MDTQVHYRGDSGPIANEGSRNVGLKGFEAIHLPSLRPATEIGSHRAMFLNLEEPDWDS